MIYTPENSQGKRLVDVNGRVIKHAKSFNDETNEVEVYVAVETSEGTFRIAMAENPGTYGYMMTPVIAKCVILGAKMVDKKGYFMNNKSKIHIQENVGDELPFAATFGAPEFQVEADAVVGRGKTVEEAEADLLTK